MKLSLGPALAMAMVLTSAPARAADDDEAAVHSPPQSPTQQKNVVVARGWALVVVSVLIGGTVTAISLSKKCPEGEQIENCQRWVSLGIWSGIGIASLGSMTGLVMVREAQRPRFQLSFSGVSATF